MAPKAKKKPTQKRPAAEKTCIGEKSHAEHNAQHEKKLTKNSTAAAGGRKNKRLNKFKLLYVLFFLLN